MKRETGNGEGAEAKRKIGSELKREIKIKRHEKDVASEREEANIIRPNKNLLS